MWAPVEKGDALPAGAILAGSLPKHGVLYIGRTDEGRIGAYNVATGTAGGKVHNLWTHENYYYSGEILVCPPGKRAVWVPYRKGDPIPRGAFHGGHTRHHGACYVGRQNAQGAVGLINTESGNPSGRMHNFWFNDGGSNCEYSGEILTLQDGALDVKAKLISIVKIFGGGNGFYDEEKVIEVGSSFATHNSESLTDLRAKVSAKINDAKFSANADTNSQIKGSFTSALAKQHQFRRDKRQFHIELSKPQYVYQAEVSVGGNIYKGDLVFSPAPLTEEYTL